MNKRLYLGAYLIISSMIIVSCEGEQPADTEVIQNKIEVVETISENVFESPDLDYHLPSALQIAGIFKKSGMKFNAEALNSAENASNYTTAASQMLNFGVYSADIAFCVTNNQTNEARELLVVIKELADAQGMSAIFDNKDLMDKFDSSLGNEDSMEYVMVEIHERTEEYMSENQMLHTSAVHYAGAWIEGMHIAVTDIENNKEKGNVGLQVIEQMEILKNIIKGLKDPKNDELAIKEVITDLENIQSTFSNFSSVTTYESDESILNLDLSDAEFKTLAELVKSIRSKVINA